MAGRGWMNGGGRMDGRKEERIGGGRRGRLMDDSRMDGRTNGRMGGRVCISKERSDSLRHILNE